MLIVKITLGVQKSDRMKEKQGSSSHTALNVELWDQISVHLIWILSCSVYLRGNVWRENGGSCFIICTHPQGMWHAWDSGEKCTKFWWGSPKERYHLEDQGVEGRMGSEWILGRLAGCVNWIRLARDRDRWRAIAICRRIYIDTSRSISTWIHIEISRSIDVDISRSASRYISIDAYRLSRSTNIGISRSLMFSVPLARFSIRKQANLTANLTVHGQHIASIYANNSVF
jgi:hypothetical protein